MVVIGQTWKVILLKMLYVNGAINITELEEYCKVARYDAINQEILIQRL